MHGCMVVVYHAVMQSCNHATMQTCHYLITPHPHSSNIPLFRLAVVYILQRAWYKYSMIYPSIYLYFLAGMVALVTVSIAYKLYKTYPLRYLYYYFYYLLLFNIFNIAMRPVHRIVVETLNLTGVQSQQSFVVIGLFVAGPLFIISLYLLIKFAAGLVEVKVSRLFKIIYFLYWGTHYIFGLILAINFFKTKEPGILYISMYLSDLLSIVMLFSVHGFVISQSRAIENPDKKRGVRTFAVIYFISYAVFNLCFYVTGNQTLNFILSFAYVLPPLIYLERFFKRFYREHPAVPVNGVNIEKMFERFNISNREQEIIQLISKGRTNREIADMLYVSLQTVKQHTYNIYRKLKVKNRVQLSNFIRNAANSNSN
jgi:DNA-binding CsgD family transcriptional regulator